MNLPNSLTILRIFFVPILVVVLLTREPNLDVLGLPIHYEVWGVLILLVAAATDAMDGYLARKRGEITTLGILLDPIADKLLISATFISLVEMGLVLLNFPLPLGEFPHRMGPLAPACNAMDDPANEPSP